MSSSSNSSRAAVPNNASLAYAVDEKKLKSGKKKLDHVPIEKAKSTINGGVHLGPGEKQADFPPNEVGARSAQGAALEALREDAASQSRPPHAQVHSGVSAVGASARGGNDLVSAGHSGEVSVQSNVVMDTTTQHDAKVPAMIQGLLSRLSTTTAQVDDYSRRQSEQISKDANERIQRIIADTQMAQDALLRDASSRALEIESEYAAKLKSFLQDLDASKAGNLAALEKDLNFRQESMLASARDEIDSVHEAATRAKIASMAQADHAVHADVDRLTEQVKRLGEEEVERRMASTTKTVITTQTKTEGVEKTNERAMTTNETASTSVGPGEPRAGSRM